MNNNMAHKNNNHETLNTLAYATLLFICILCQCLLFHFQAFHHIYGSTIFTKPLVVLAFYLPKISIALAVCSLLFIFKSRQWTVIFDIILTLWIFAELIYYRVNGFFIDQFSLTIVGNMKGFWNSIISFIYPGDFFILLFPILLICGYFLLGKKNCVHRIGFIIVLLCSIILHASGAVLVHYLRQDKVTIRFNPFMETTKAQSFWGFTTRDYVSQTSVLHAICYDAIQLALLPIKADHINLNEEEEQTVEVFLRDPQFSDLPASRTVIILFESLENWVIGPTTTPNIDKLLKEHDNCLWAKKVKKETAAGISGDGQMIVNTGLLPIRDGATCFRYPDNTFPSISSLFENSALILPGEVSVWNQARMNNAYSIDTTYVIPESLDNISCSRLNDIYPEHPFVLVITAASHAPFIDCSTFSPVDLNPKMPQKMKNYINCVHYTDSCLGEFLEKVGTDSTLTNSTIVITGDHTIFDDAARKQFNDYCMEYGENYDVLASYCPLIVYSPSISEKTILDEECYQMDIYPTILGLIGCKDYYWQGFGVDLLDTTATRKILESDAIDLSDKIIRANYFKEYQNQFEE